MQESLDLKRILQILRQGLKWIVLCALLGTILAAVYVSFFVKSQYVASISFYVNNSKTATGAEQTVNLNDINAAQKLVDTYIVILQSNRVLNQVIAQAGLDCSATQLRNMIKMTSVNNTEIMQVNVTTESAEQSTSIARTIASVAPEEILRVVKYGYVESIDEASLATTKKVSKHVPLASAIGLIVGAIAAVGILIIRDVMDNTVKDEDDLKRRYNVPVLGEIPNYNSQFKGGYAKYEN